ncbi:Major facilitator [Theobroma cacao]|nr:Major facilitator [Theobroma cacao]
MLSFLITAESFVFSSGDGAYNNMAMRGRHLDAYSMYKRGSKDYINAHDKEQGSARLLNGAGKDIGNPSWNRSLPHILVATLSSLLFGYHLGVVNETLESMSHDLGFHGNTMAEGLVVSTCLGGAFVGSLFSGSIADGVGRRRAFQLCALPMIIGSSMSATAKNLWGMLLGRLFVGSGMGIGPPVAALYVTEVSPAYVRGTYGSCTQIATCLGLMGALFIGLPAKETEGWWRICFWVSAVPAAMLALFMEFSAESPQWLFKRGRGADAEAEFEKLLGGPYVKGAMAELSKSDRGDEADTVRFSELLYGRHRKVIFIGSTLFALQQLSGINAVFYFSSTVFKNAGVPSESANICVGIANLIGSFVALLLMDKLGRKLLLIGSFSGMAVAMGLQATSASSLVSSSNEVYMSVGGMLLFVLTFAMGAGPVPGLLLSEMFPGRIRAKAMSICMAVHWVINFFVGLLFLRLLEQIGPLVLNTIFGTFCLLAVIFVKKNVLETKGKSLQEIEIAFLPPE